jgi:hypothetical protein
MDRKFQFKQVLDLAKEKDTNDPYVKVPENYQKIFEFNRKKSVDHLTKWDRYR